MVFGLSKDKQAADAKPADKTKQDTSSDDGAADEAKKLLEEMQAKEDNGDCAFC
jgi:hypothetical protein